MKALLAASIALAFGVTSAGGQVVDSTLWIANDDVRAIVRHGNTIYIGGYFTRVGPATGSAVPLSMASGTVDQPFPRVIGSVEAIIEDGSGGWYLGGHFSSVGGLARPGLAHVVADGSVATWNPDLQGGVNSLALGGGRVYVGGYFTSGGGPNPIGIAALDAMTGAVVWSQRMTCEVNALALDGNVLYAGGCFSSIAGLSRPRIAALDATTGAVTAWNPRASGTQAEVHALAVSGNTVYVGGYFSSIGGQARNHIAALDAMTGTATAWNPNASGIGGTTYQSVGVIALAENVVYVGGYFTSIGGQSRNCIAALDPPTGAATDWNPNASGGSQLPHISALAVRGSTVYVGGYFTSMGGQARNHIAALDAATGAVTAWNPNANSLRAAGVKALSAGESTVYAGGAFTSMGGVSRNGLAALDTGTGAATGWDPDVTGEVYSLAMGCGALYAGGRFTGIGGQIRNNIAAVDPTTGGVTEWNPNSDNSVVALAVNTGTVYAAGEFTSIGERARNHIAALDATTGVATDWNPNANNDVRALEVAGSTVYAGGWFSQIGGQVRPGIAALDATTGVATAWNPNPSELPEIYALALSGNTLYIGGQFDSMGGQERWGAAALDVTTGAATDWNPNPYVPVVTALAAGGSTVLIGGDFETVGGQRRQILAEVDATTGALTDWDPNAERPYTCCEIYALELAGDTVYVGGDFFEGLGGQPGCGIARILPRPATVEVAEMPRGVSTSGVTRMWPNPSSGAMQIEYVVAQRELARLSVLDVAGREVAVLARGSMAPGRYSMTWNGHNGQRRLPSGIYFVRWESHGRSMSSRVVFLR